MKIRKVAARRTRLLALLVGAALVTAAPAISGLPRLRRQAAAEAQDWAACQRYLADLGQRPLALSANGSAGVPDLNRRICDAATSAGVQQNLSSVEPGVPRPIPNSGQSELPVYLRFEAMTLRELCAFLSKLGSDDPLSHVKNVELEPVPADAPVTTRPTADAAERWTADVTVAYPINTGPEVQAQ